MERVAGQEPFFEEFLRFGAAARGVDCGPLGWQECRSFEAPLRVALGDSFADVLRSEVVEEASSYDLTDFGFVVGDQVLGDPAHDLRDPFLPLLVPVGHLDLASRQA